MGELGLQPHEFYCMTWTDYIRYSQGYRIRLARSFEAARMIAHTVLWVNIQKGKPVPKAEDVWPILTDPEPEKIAPQSQKEIKAIQKRYMELWQAKKV